MTGSPLSYGPDDPRAATLVTLDGPAGVGKSTTARAVADALGYRYLDSGSLYRAVTLALLRAHVPNDRVDDLDAEALRGLGVAVRPGAETLELLLDGAVIPDAELRTPEVTALVSHVARLPAVRDWLFDAQQAAASQGRLVADGRDMGTVVFPQARTKVFLVADPRERARRRLRDHGVAEPTEAELAGETERLMARDAQDEARAVAPLRRAEDARELDTTHLSFAEQVAQVVAWARGEAAGEASGIREGAPEGSEGDGSV